MQHIWCHIIDHEQILLDGDIFSVTVSPETSIDDLKLMALARKPNELAHVDSNPLRVWRCIGLKVPGEDEDDEEFKARVRSADLSKAQKLRVTRNVLSLNMPLDEMLLIQLPDTRQDKRKGGEEDGLPPEVKRMRTEIASAPSHLAPASEFRKIVEPEHGICCNRPFEPTRIPLVLLHEVFAMFKDRCEQAPSGQALACIDELAPVGCRWYDLEINRRVAIQEVLRKYTGLHFHEQKIPGTDLMTDGNLAVIVMPAAIRECKNEHGDALNQAILYYANLLDKALGDPLRFCNSNTRFPSILVVDMGPYLGFYGVVWDGMRVRAEPLTPLFDLSTHQMEIKARCAIAATFDALKVAVENLHAHYSLIKARATEVDPTPPIEYDPRLQKARGYPFLTSYEDLNGQGVTFTYDARLDDKKLVFSAIVNQHDSAECVVKFTSRYSEDAHKFLASRGLAPRLRRCVRISADWTAVIMDRSKYQALYGLNLNKEQRKNVRREVTSMAQTLHEGGFVHGDIRDTNLLVDLGSNPVSVQLIDFDWAGRIGEVKYPIAINKISVRRPHSVTGGGPITKEHDVEMVSYLFT